MRAGAGRSRRRAVGLFVHLPFSATRCACGTFVAITELDALPRTLAATLAEVVRLRPHHVSVYLLEMDKPHAPVQLARRHPHLFPGAGRDGRPTDLRRLSPPACAAFSGRLRPVSEQP